MLRYDPAERITAAEAMQHPFFDSVRPAAEGGARAREGDDLSDGDGGSGVDHSHGGDQVDGNGPPDGSAGGDQRGGGGAPVGGGIQQRGEPGGGQPMASARAGQGGPAEDGSLMQCGGGSLEVAVA